MNTKILLDILEDCQLLMEAQKRLANDTGITYTQEQLMAQLGVTEDELNNLDDVALD